MGALVVREQIEQRVPGLHAGARRALLDLELLQADHVGVEAVQGLGHRLGPEVLGAVLRVVAQVPGGHPQGGALRGVGGVVRGVVDLALAFTSLPARVGIDAGFPLSLTQDGIGILDRVGVGVRIRVRVPCRVSARIGLATLRGPRVRGGLTASRGPARVCSSSAGDDEQEREQADHGTLNYRSGRSLTTASTSISTTQRGSMSDGTPTMVAAGRACPKAAAWAPCRPRRCGHRPGSRG